MQILTTINNETGATRHYIDGRRCTLADHARVAFGRRAHSFLTVTRGRYTRMYRCLS